MFEKDSLNGERTSDARKTYVQWLNFASGAKDVSMLFKVVEAVIVHKLIRGINEDEIEIQMTQEDFLRGIVEEIIRHTGSVEEAFQVLYETDHFSLKNALIELVLASDNEQWLQVAHLFLNARRDFFGDESVLKEKTARLAVALGNVDTHDRVQQIKVDSEVADIWDD